MNRPALLLACAASLAAAGCALRLPDFAGVPDAPPPPMIVPGDCDAQAAAFAVGKAYNGPLGEEARWQAHAERVRAVAPGQMVTMEFDARRLTLDLDAQGRVVGARCG